MTYLVKNGFLHLNSLQSTKYATPLKSFNPNSVMLPLRVTALSDRNLHCSFAFVKIHTFDEFDKSSVKLLNDQ